MKAAGKTYDPVIYDGAGHGFMRAGQDPAGNEANKKAFEQGFARMTSIIDKPTLPQPAAFNGPIHPVAKAVKAARQHPALPTIPRCRHENASGKQQTEIGCNNEDVKTVTRTPRLLVAGRARPHHS